MINSHRSSSDSYPHRKAARPRDCDLRLTATASVAGLNCNLKFMSLRLSSSHGSTVPVTFDTTCSTTALRVFTSSPGASATIAVSLPIHY